MGSEDGLPLLVRCGVMMKTDLVIAAARDARSLALCARGVAWSNLSQVDRVVVLVNNADGTNATMDVRRSAVVLSLEHGWDVIEYAGDGACGDALAWYVRGAPAQGFVKIDSDMFPIHRGWVGGLLRELRNAELVSGMTNANWHCSGEFMRALDRDPSPLLYKDAARNMEIWLETLSQWQKVTEKGTFRDFYVETPEWISGNAFAFSRGWFDSIPPEAWAGKMDEAVINLPAGRRAPVPVIGESLLLHWGYGPATRQLEPMWNDASERLLKLWGET